MPGSLIYLWSDPPWGRRWTKDLQRCSQPDSFSPSGLYVCKSFYLTDIMKVTSRGAVERRPQGVCEMKPIPVMVQVSFSAVLWLPIAIP